MGYGYDTSNNEGKAILDFVLAYHIVVAKTYLKREILK